MSCGGQGLMKGASDVIQAGEKQKPHDYRLIAVVAALALTMETIDATALISALPAIARHFGLPATSLSALITAYLLALAIFIPASGRLADRFGSRTVFRGAILLFMASSLLCAVAPSIEFMILARFLQGMAGAMMNPIARLVVLRSAPRHRMVSAHSWLILPTTLGPILGPPLGGFLVTYAGWRWIFYINLPIGLIALMLVSLLFEEHRATHASRFDGAGFLLCSLSLSCLLFGLQFATHDDDASITVTLLFAGCALAIGFVHHALRRSHPILDIRLLDLPLFRLSLMGGSLTRITQGAQPYLLPLMFQLGFGMTAVAAGTLVLATALGALVTKLVAGTVLKRTGFRIALIVNGMLASAGYAIVGWFRPGWPWWAMAAILFASGTAMSFQFSAYNVLAYQEVPPERMSAATSLHTMVQQLLLSVGVSVGAVVLHVSMAAGARTVPAFDDFTTAFMLVCVISATATVVNWRFPRDAGAEIGGRMPNAASL